MKILSILVLHRWPMCTITEWSRFFLVFQFGLWFSKVQPQSYTIVFKVSRWSNKVLPSQSLERTVMKSVVCFDGWAKNVVAKDANTCTYITRVNVDRILRYKPPAEEGNEKLMSLTLFSLITSKISLDGMQIYSLRLRTREQFPDSTREEMWIR